MRVTTAQSTLPNRQREKPETSVVPHSARCTDADAVAGARPVESNSVVEVTPYAMPSEPSTICAASPTTAKIKSFSMRSFRLT